MAKNKSKSATVRRKSSPKTESVGKGRLTPKSGVSAAKPAPVGHKAAQSRSTSRKSSGVPSGEPVSSDVLKGFKRTLLRAYLTKPGNKPK